MRLPTAEFTEFDGIKAALHPVRTPAYPLARNLTVRDGIATPVRKHVQLDNPGITKPQAIFMAGNILLVVGSGSAYYRDISADGAWLPVAGWEGLSASAYRVWLTPVARTSNRNDRSGTRMMVTEAFDAGITQYPRMLVAQDGVSQAKLIYDDGTASVAGTYAAWSKTNRNYIPVGKFGAFSAGKYIVSDGERLYHSVSGRPNDFVVNIDANGNKGGDAATTAFVPTYDTHTALIPSADGSYLLTTLYATYLLTPSEGTIFGEPYYIVQELFQIGAMNSNCFVNIEGNLCFISQTGIHSFNEGQHYRNDSNNTAFSAPIRRILADVQSDHVCAVRFRDYAIFAIDTIFGEKFVVYDTLSKQFMSVDDCPGGVKQFAVSRVNGQQRLFFITDSEIYEAYAGESAIAQINFGPFTAVENVQMSGMRLDFVDALNATVVAIVNGTVHESRTFNGEHVSVPVETHSVTGKSIEFQLNWRNASLHRIAHDIQPVQDSSAAVATASAADYERYILIGGDWFSAELVPPGAVFNGSGYLEVEVDGPVSVVTAHEWDTVTRNEHVNCVYLRGTPGAAVTASVRRIDVPLSLLRGGHTIICTGRLDVEHTAALCSREGLTLFTGCAAGEASAAFYAKVSKQPRFAWHRLSLLDLGIVSTELSGSYSLAADGTLATGSYGETHGVTKTSMQSRLLMAADPVANFRLLVLPQAAYTDSGTGHAALQWPWTNVDVFLQGEAPCLELIRQNDGVYISAGTISATPIASSTAGRAEFYATSNGYWVIDVSAQNAKLSCYDLTGAQLYTTDLARRA